MSPILLTTGFIGTQGGQQDIFFDNVNQNTARTLTAVPANQVPFDQQVELVEVYYILKGTDHGAGGGALTLQLHTVVENKQGGGFGLTPPFLFYEVWACEC